MRQMIQRCIREFKLAQLHWKHIVLVLFVNIYVFTVIGRNMVFFYDRPINEIQIQDFFFNLMPETKAVWIQNIPVSILLIFSLPMMLILPFVYGKCHKHGIFAVNNFVIFSYFITIIHFVRVVNYNITILPDPSPHCRMGAKMERPKNFYGKSLFI